MHLPPLAPGTRATYLKFLPRTHDDYATVSVAAALRLDGDGRCEHVRVALGGAAGVPLRARVVEDALVGEQLTDARIAEAAALVDGIVDPPTMRAARPRTSDGWRASGRSARSGPFAISPMGSTDADGHR